MAPGKIDQYVQKARQRATRRKSSANLLLLLLHWPLMLALWFLQVKYIYILGTGDDCGGKILVCLPRGLATVVFTIAPFFPSVGLSMLLTNALLWLIPPVRRIFDREAAPYPETSFRHTQKMLLKITAVALLAAWPAMFLALKYL